MSGSCRRGGVPNLSRPIADTQTVSTSCHRCGIELAGGNFCGACGHRIEQPDSSYRPSVPWIVVGVVGWLATVPAFVPHGKPAAYAAGAVFASLLLPAVVRVVWTVAVHRGPQLWGRALLSPWLWVVAAVFNVLATSSRTSHN
jgi:hypothetical protein